MKSRITYVVQEPEEFSPEQIQVKDNGDTFEVKDIRATREMRLTIGLDELPSEIRGLLQQWEEFYLRWTSSTAYKATPPFTSRTPPGMHVFFRPHDKTTIEDFCDTLFIWVDNDIRCRPAHLSSIELLTLEQKPTGLYQYFDYLHGGISFSSKLRKALLETEDGTCRRLISDLRFASYLDIDIDNTLQQLTITAAWAGAFGHSGWSEKWELHDETSRVEIGILTLEANADPEDIQFGGFLTVLGQDKEPKATRFQSPTRHYPLLQTSVSTTETPKPNPLTYTTSFVQPTGLHPTLIMSFPTEHLKAPEPTCRLYSYQTIPSYLFIDRYQFTDALFLKSKNLNDLCLLTGAIDLEAPDWVISHWGSAALFELATPASPDVKNTWNISIPMHLRYLPVQSRSHTQKDVPWPIVFWACSVGQDTNLAINPFDRRHLGYETYFEPRTRFMHVDPAVVGDRVQSMVARIDVPVLDMRQTAGVHTGTVGIVLVAFLALCWTLFGKVPAGDRSVSAKEKKQ